MAAPDVINTFNPASASGTINTFSNLFSHGQPYRKNDKVKKKPDVYTLDGVLREYEIRDEELNNFFFEKVEGLDEYLLFLIITKYFNIYDSYEKYDDTRKRQKISGGLGGFENYNDIINSRSANLATNPAAPITLVYVMKLFKELSHDFTGDEKTLNDEPNIRQFYLAHINRMSGGADSSSATRNRYLSQFRTNSNEYNVAKLFGSLYDESGEWSFYKNLLEYYLERCDGLNDVTMVKYRSQEDKAGNKTYLLRDINSEPGSGPSYTQLFNYEQFSVRYPDNSTSDEVLSYLVRRQNIPAGITFAQTIVKVENAPSLTDPATTGLIPIAQFYRNEIPGFFEFQKCQDLNNYFDENNKHILKIMSDGLDTFCSFFGGSFAYGKNFTYGAGAWKIPEDATLVTSYKNRWDIAPVKFICATANGTVRQIDETYVEQIRQLNYGTPVDSFRYIGIRVKYGVVTNAYVDLQVGDTTIKNITSLLNDRDFIKRYLKNSSDQVLQQNASWFRLCNFANFIRLSSVYSGNMEPTCLGFLIVCLKALGDWFQVFYSSSIQFNPELKSQFQEIIDKIYLSSSDKNTVADCMMYASTSNIVSTGTEMTAESGSSAKANFLMNGCSIRPYQNLKDRFVNFFNTDLTDTRNSDNCDIGSTMTDANGKPVDNDVINKIIPREQGFLEKLKLGNVKAIFTNIRPSDVDYRPINQKLASDIISLVTNDQEKQNFLIEILSSPEINITPSDIQTYSTAPPNDNDVKMKLQKIYKLFRNVLDNYYSLGSKIDGYLNIFELEQLALTKIINIKRNLTSDELKELCEKLYSNPMNPNSVDESDLEIESALVSNIPQDLRTNTTIISRVNAFKQSIKQKIAAKRTRLEQLINKITPQNTGVKTSSRIKKTYYGAIDFIRDVKQRFFLGGKNKTIRHHSTKTIKRIQKQKRNTRKKSLQNKTTRKYRY